MLDIHELERRPGTMKRVARAAAAPADFGIDGVVGVPEAADVELDLRLESVMEGVLVSGTAQAPIAGECARCLDPISDTIVVDLQQLFVYAADDDEEPSPEVAEDDMPVVDDMIDLEQPVRDAVVLALPQAPLCRPDCPGLCAQCGARLADDPEHSHDIIDPRWAALEGLLPDEEESGPKNGAGPT